MTLFIAIYVLYAVAKSLIRRKFRIFRNLKFSKSFVLNLKMKSQDLATEGYICRISVI